MSEIRVVSFLDGRTELWLTVDGAATALDGLCIGLGDTYEAGLRDATEDLEAALDHLRAMHAAASAPTEAAK